MMIASSQDKSAAQGLLTDTTAITFEPAPGNYGELNVWPTLLAVCLGGTGQCTL